MYLRTVLRSRPLWRAMTETDMPCRCHSRIMTTSLSWITACPPDHQEQHRRREPAGLPGGGQKHQQPRSPGENSIGRSGEFHSGINRGEANLAIISGCNRNDIVTLRQQSMSQEPEIAPAVC